MADSSQETKIMILFKDLLRSWHVCASHCEFKKILEEFNRFGNKNGPLLTSSYWTLLLSGAVIVFSDMEHYGISFAIGINSTNSGTASGPGRIRFRNRLHQYQ